MSHGLILFPRSTPGGSRSAFRWWIEAAESVGLTVEIAFFEDISIRVSGPRTEALLPDGTTLRPDFVVMRGYCSPLSEFFEQSGAKVVNSTRSMTVSRDKLLTHLTLSDASLPSPVTIWCPVVPSYRNASEFLSSSRFIIKAREGSKGEQVWLADNEETYRKITAKCPEGILIQEYVETSCGRDLRVWVIGGRAVCGVIRRAKSDFRSNFALGGTTELFDVPADAGLLAERAAKACGLFFAGVDLLFTSSGFTVCEVNGNAGFRTLSVSGGPDILKIFFDEFRQQISGGSR